MVSWPGSLRPGPFSLQTIMNFEETYKNRMSKAEDIINYFLPEETGYAQKVCEAMNYSVNAGGKRLRPMMMMESHIMFNGDGKLIGPFMAAMEMIHTYSLVHDDLPAMDNDELRRGKPTTWKQYGDGMAVLAGDALLNYSMETALKAFLLCENETESVRVQYALMTLFNHSGINGMIGGQCADLEAENMGDKVTEDQLLYIHTNKTAALIQASLMIGACLAGADAEALELLARAGYDIGIAFQIQDDILDITSSAEELGKPIGSDERNDKLTFVSLHGLEESKAEVIRLTDEALYILSSFENRNTFLEDLVRSLVGRKN